MQMTDKEINILGTPYTLKIDKELVSTNMDGEHQYYSKIIRVRPMEGMLKEESDETAKKIRYNEVLRHEIVHAFFSESGLDDYSNNEQLVDWISMQAPKIVTLFVELGIVC